jgi:hypothetical protein
VNQNIFSYIPKEERRIENIEEKKYKERKKRENASHKETNKEKRKGRRRREKLSMEIYEKFNLRNPNFCNRSL